jgi:hypothetical protein
MGAVVAHLAFAQQPPAATGEAGIVAEARKVVSDFPRSHEAELAQEVVEAVAAKYVEDASFDVEKLKQIAESFPDTTAGSLAEQRLDRIDYFQREARAYEAVIDAEKKDDIDKLRTLARPAQDTPEDKLMEGTKSQEYLEQRLRKRDALAAAATARQDFSQLMKNLARSQLGQHVLQRVKRRKQQREAEASRRLVEALRRSTLYDQRWRRLVELTQQFPGTGACEEAQRLFDEHLAEVPPVAIRNKSDEVLIIEYEPTYQLRELHVLKPGAERTVHTAFPLQIYGKTLQTKFNVMLRAGQDCEYDGHIAVRGVALPMPASYYFGQPE